MMIMSELLALLSELYRQKSKREVTMNTTYVMIVAGLMSIFSFDYCSMPDKKDMVELEKSIKNHSTKVAVLEKDLTNALIQCELAEKNYQECLGSSTDCSEWLSTLCFRINVWIHVNEALTQQELLLHKETKKYKKLVQQLLS